MKVKEIKALIELVSEKGFAEFEIEKKGFRLRVRRFSDAALPVSTGPLIISSPISGAAELPPRREQRVVEVELRPAVQPAQVESAPAAAENQPAAQPEQLHTIKSPIVGTFYRSPSPTAESFVKIGDNVEPDTVVCIIEAMKLMNEIQAEVSGEVVKVLVENGQPVEYGQPLFSIRK
jgi:acetyl-CoA carboxylase biotin carboxyl carrier protein